MTEDTLEEMRHLRPAVAPPSEEAMDAGMARLIAALAAADSVLEIRGVDLGVSEVEIEAFLDELAPDVSVQLVAAYPRNRSHHKIRTADSALTWKPRQVGVAKPRKWSEPSPVSRRTQSSLGFAELNSTARGGFGDDRRQYSETERSRRDLWLSGGE